MKVKNAREGDETWEEVAQNSALASRKINNRSGAFVVVEDSMAFVQVAMAQGYRVAN